jgi:hypothetical protein
MTRSTLSRWLGAAVGALTIGAASSSVAQTVAPAGQSLHLAAAPSDFAALGLGKQILAWEDGRRTPQSDEYFEWWYFDGLLDDGTIVVVWFGDNWFYGSHKRAVDIDLTPPGKPTRHILRTFDEPGSFSKEAADVRIGSNRFKGDLDTYSIQVDPAETEGVGCDLVLKRRVASYRPATGYIEAGQQFFAWLAAAPEGAVTGTLTVDGVTRNVTGSGYHDHNWGNVSPAKLFDNWWWGRGTSGGQTVIASAIHGKAGVGGTSVPLLFIADGTQVEVDAFGPDVSVTEGAPAPHPDPRHERPIGSGVAFSTKDGGRADFRISNRVLTSTNLLQNQSLAIKAAAHALSLKPWYTRFESPITITPPGQTPTEGKGTLEYFELK